MLHSNHITFGCIYILCCEVSESQQILMMAMMRINDHGCEKDPLFNRNTKANSLIWITRQVQAQMFARKITDATFNVLH